MNSSSALRQVGALSVLIPLSFSPSIATAQTNLPIVISGSVELNFGTISAGGGGSVIVSTAGARSVTGTVVDISGGGLETNGVFSISGSTGVMIDLSVTAPDFTVSNGAGGIMTVDSFNIVVPGGGRTATVTLATSPQNFPLGATLRVSSGQAAGTYTGDYVLSANYQ